MKHHSDLIQSAPSMVAFRLCRHPWLAALPAILVALPGLGCFRATGIQRPDVVAEEISPVGGDRVKGLKAQGAPGDFYLGNDYLEIAVDGTPFGEREGVAGAAGGGSIIDAGEIALDQNYKRVSIPSDTLDRLTPVLNQDPSISLVFSRFKPINSDNQGSLEMEGFVHDPSHKLTGATWDALGRVQDLSVLHVISLGKSDRYFTIKTTVTNKGTIALPVRNIGDFLFQQAGGFRFNVPASEDMAGNALTNWGVEIPATGPGTTFGDPSQAVKATMVAFMGVEPAGTTEDGHSTLGLLPVDADQLVITSDSQQALTQTRPVFPQKLIAGSLPVASLAPGASLSFSRRLFLVGGSSASGNVSNQASGILDLDTGGLSGLMNAMAQVRFSLRTQDSGLFSFQPAGTAIRQGPYPSEFRIERQVGTLWKLERVEWVEPNESTPASGSYFFPQIGVSLATGTYRMMVRNAFGSANFANLINTSNADRPDLPGPINIESKQLFLSNATLDYICPERNEVLGATGSVIANKLTSHQFYTRQIDGTVNSIQPTRINVVGEAGTADPSLKRTRSLASNFIPIYQARVVVGSNYGVYGFSAGNQLFAASLPGRSPASFWLAPGDYTAYAIRGPLSYLDSQSLSAFDGQTRTVHAFTAKTAIQPSGWTSFDMPGPSLASTGGILPVEKLSSALAEGVQIVGMTEKDRLVDSTSLALDFRNEFQVPDISDTDRTAIGSDPFVIEARSSDLGGYGSVTALFTPSPRNERNGGARNSSGWTLADFLTQAEGQYNVIHRPRGPQGLFAVKGFNRAEALNTGANLWWSATSALSSGKTQGGFDALELLRGEVSDANGQPLSLQVPANATDWFNEFLEVRADWFALLKQQPSTSFTKGLGLSSAKYSLDTPVGLARTYLKATGFTQSNTSPILQALQSGAAVASTGPMLDATLTAPAGTTAYGPGALVPGPQATVTLTVNLWAPDWVPVDELRVVINGTTQVLDINQLQPLLATDAAYDKRLRRGTYTLTLPAGKDAWVVVEAGVPLSTTGAYAIGTPWNKLMKGIYPIAVTNPIFVDTTGGGYTPPGL